MAGVIGIGGIFIKFRDPAAIRQWYRDVLDITTNEYGILFEFGGESAPRGYLQYGTFEKDSGYFGNPEQQCMINFRVDNMEELIMKLKANSVNILNEPEKYSYGTFLHIEDPEGNRIELWEPVDSVFEGGDEAKMPLR